MNCGIPVGVSNCKLIGYIDFTQKCFKNL